MKIGIISDTHDRLDYLAAAIKTFSNAQVDIVIHCGDWVSPFTLEYYDHVMQDNPIPTKSVFGNNEGDIKRIIERNSALKNPIEFAPKLVFELEFERKKIAVFHGHDNVILNSLINSKQYNAVFTGHTHETRNEIIDSTLVFNPGTTAGVASSRITNKHTIGIYTPSTNTAEIISLSNLK